MPAHQRLPVCTVSITLQVQCEVGGTLPPLLGYRCQSAPCVVIALKDITNLRADAGYEVR